MNFTIRKGKKADLPAVLELVKELAAFEKEPNAVQVTVEEMERDGFGDSPAFWMWVAEVENKVVGVAVNYMRYSTWKGKTVYLEDIVVNEQYRGKGIGKALFERVMRDAKEIGARRMSWQVLDWNEPAIRFYEKYEASFDGEWLNCGLDESQIHQLTSD